MKSILLLTMFGASVTAFGNPLPAYDFDSIQVSQDAPLSFGFWFETNQAVLVSDLGYFDAGGDGFGTPHQVGIFGTDTNLLVSTTLGQGTTGTLIGDFRYAAINPILLLPDTWYLIAATSGGPEDPWGYGLAGAIDGLSVSPLIRVPRHASAFLYKGDDTEPNDILDFPVNRYSGYQLYAGPNLLLEATSAPEPGALGILAGAFTLGFLALRKRRSAEKKERA